MTNTVKYRNADDLLKNCTVDNDCMVWKFKYKLPPLPLELQDTESHAQHVPPNAPLMGPRSPLAVMMNTTSIARILFILCRFLPASTKLVKRCTTPFCVNPYHHTEARVVLQQRRALMARGRDPHALLPSQESTAHLILNLPKGVTRASMAPKDPAVVSMLMMSASIAGFDGKGIHKSMLRDFDVPQADPGKPVLTIRARPIEKPAVPDEGPEESMDDFFAGIERSLTARGIGAKT